MTRQPHAVVAQLEEHPALTRNVGGSTPLDGTVTKREMLKLAYHVRPGSVRSRFESEFPDCLI